MPPKCDVGGRKCRNFRFRHEIANTRDRARKTFPSGSLVSGVHQAGCDIAAIQNIYFCQLIVSFVKFI